MKILIVEDDKKIASFIKKGLTEQSYTVDIAGDGDEGERLAGENIYDVMLIDIMIPRKSGFSLCQSVRSFNKAVPIIMLTALDSTEDKLRGFEAGADDYLVKPFEFQELLARIRALLRRNTNQEIPNSIHFAGLEMDLSTHTVKRSGRVIDCTAREFALLEYLLRHKNKVVTRTDIAEHVWDINFDSESNVIDVYVSFLRKKINNGFSPKLIQTVIGVGYILKENPGEED
ncbi:MAG: response regulator transcription factor [Chitinivibrionales bacterium]|nr:response regulator transcription factor [Chitinivibrionales bacterium]